MKRRIPHILLLVGAVTAAIVFLLVDRPERGATTHSSRIEESPELQNVTAPPLDAPPAAERTNALEETRHGLTVSVANTEGDRLDGWIAYAARTEVMSTVLDRQVPKEGTFLDVKDARVIAIVGAEGFCPDVKRIHSTGEQAVEFVLQKTGSIVFSVASGGALQDGRFYLAAEYTPLANASEFQSLLHDTEEDPEHIDWLRSAVMSFPEGVRTPPRSQADYVRLAMEILRTSERPLPELRGLFGSQTEYGAFSGSRLIEGLPAGKYLLGCRVETGLADASSLEPHEVIDGQQWIYRLDPMALMDKVETVEVAPGECTTVEVEVVPCRTLRGTVFLGARRLARAKVELWVGDRAAPIEFRTASDGTFVAPLNGPAGTMVVRYNTARDGNPGFGYSKFLDFEKTEYPSHVVVQLDHEAAIEVDGIVYQPDGTTPASGVDVSVGGNRGCCVVTDASGRFRAFIDDDRVSKVAIADLDTESASFHGKAHFSVGELVQITLKEF